MNSHDLSEINLVMPLFGLSVSQCALSFLETLPHKIRAQIIKRVKALILNPHPQGSKKLQGIESNHGESLYRERSGDYRILYVVRSDPPHVAVIDIDNRKDIYK